MELAGYEDNCAQMTRRNGEGVIKVVKSRSRRVGGLERGAGAGAAGAFSGVLDRDGSRRLAQYDICIAKMNQLENHSRLRAMQTKSRLELFTPATNFSRKLV